MASECLDDIRHNHTIHRPARAVVFLIRGISAKRCGAILLEPYTNLFCTSGTICSSKWIEGADSPLYKNNFSSLLHCNHRCTLTTKAVTRVT